MRYKILLASLICVGVSLSGAVRAVGTDAVKPSPEVEKLAADMAKKLAALCPPAAKDDVAAHEKCASGLRDTAFIPWASEGILFGGDQSNLKISKRQLTHFKPAIWQLMYLSLFTFTGKWSVDQDPREHVDIIHIEAYFRNAMPSGEFPYPFWHSAAKWNGYETANELKFYLNHKDQVFVVTRSDGGSEAARGPYAHVTPPAFDGKWQWIDASGHLQPHTSLFSNKYSAGNPYLPALDKAYRNFAMEARKGTCLGCHAPTNEANMDHLVLLQTPLHASGEIDRVLKEVKNREMPEDELGLRKDIDPRLRASILRTGGEFRDVLAQADRWEAKQHHHE